MTHSKNPNPKASFLSPPVIQMTQDLGFIVSIEVNALCLGHVEWGLKEDQLDRISKPLFGGLVKAEDECIVVHVKLEDDIDPGQPIFYRIVGVPINFESAYHIHHGEPFATEVRALALPHPTLESVTLGVVNDTHHFQKVIPELAQHLEQFSPDLLVWNGDVCHEFNEERDLTSILLSPGACGPTSSSGGWASKRPLLFVPGNHDVRGMKAKQLPKVFPPNSNPELPHNKSFRLGPLAIITLDAGEDKPDNHPVFAGTAAYEPYRKLQREWLEEQLALPHIASAPYKLAFCHIPLRGLDGDGDGTELEEPANFSGEGAKEWLPLLVNSQFNGVVSGHTHEYRITPPDQNTPIYQIVGGGPGPKQATVIKIEASHSSLNVEIRNLNNEVVLKAELS
jgi:acid phosphatase type 7